MGYRSRSLHGAIQVKHMMISNVLGEFASITGVWNVMK